MLSYRIKSKQLFTYIEKLYKWYFTKRKNQEIVLLTQEGELIALPWPTFENKRMCLKKDMN